MYLVIGENSPFLQGMKGLSQVILFDNTAKHSLTLLQ